MKHFLHLGLTIGLFIGEWSCPWLTPMRWFAPRGLSRRMCWAPWAASCIAVRFITGAAWSFVIAVSEAHASASTAVVSANCLFARGVNVLDCETSRIFEKLSHGNINLAEYKFSRTASPYDCLA